MERYPKGSHRPHAGWWIRWIIRLYSFFPFYKSQLYRKLLLHSLKLPLNTSISKGFFCLTENLSVGYNCGLGNSFIRNIARVSIGNNCSFSYNNIILTGTHDLSDFNTIIAKPVTIGNNVWITTNVIILPGVTIGDNVIIGAGSVVNRDIPSNVLAAGNPCRVIKSITFNK